MCGSAAATAGLNRSEWPTAQTTPRRAAASTTRVASATENASGFSTSTCGAGVDAAERDLGVRLGRHRDRDRVHTAADVPPVRVGGGAVGGRDLRGAPRRRVHDSHQLHAGHRGEQPRVMPPEMADADHRDAKAAVAGRRHAVRHASVRTRRCRRHRRRRTRPGRRVPASCRRRPTARSRRRRAWPRWWRCRSPARRSACPVSAWRP